MSLFCCLSSSILQNRKEIWAFGVEFWPIHFATNLTPSPAHIYWQRGKKLIECFLIPHCHLSTRTISNLVPIESRPRVVYSWTAAGNDQICMKTTASNQPDILFVLSFGSVFAIKQTMDTLKTKSICISRRGGLIEQPSEQWLIEHDVLKTITSFRCQFCRPIHNYCLHKIVTMERRFAWW